MNYTQAVSYHLQHNHYPPVPTNMIPVCMQALEECVHGDMHELLDLPEDTTYKGATNAPAYAICESHHMYDFVHDCIACNQPFIMYESSDGRCADCNTQEKE